jgi:CheY-like chemotaxis protein
VNRTVAVRLLEKLGHRVAEARNGREALDAIEAVQPIIHSRARWPRSRRYIQVNSATRTNMTVSVTIL